MKKISTILCCLLGLGAVGQKVSIIPQPVEMSQPAAGGILTLGPATPLVLEGSGLQNAADFLNGYLKEFYGFSLGPKGKSTTKKALILKMDRKENENPDAYTLEVNARGITLSASSGSGAFYGIQSLIQLLPTDPKEPLTLPFISIKDFPRFQYRGLHLDVGRHFFPVSFIKKYLDFIALAKMNYFHWHLTEDQGWRMEIKKYPALTQVGAYREGTIIGHYPGTGNDNIRYGGYYTQDEIREVIDYASKRYITIIPEIEMPGHGSAAIAAYPWLSCFENESTKLSPNFSEKGKNSPGKKVQETWGVFEDVFCAGNDSTFTFLENVLDEVIALFPAAYIHIGGDECPKSNWKKCPKCQQRMKDLGLKTEHELQSYFIQRIEKYINSKGRKIIGWDEILEGGLAPNATVMSWRGEQGGIEAAKQSHQVIMTPTTYVYFDYAQKKPEDSLVIGGFLPLEKVYGYEPLPSALSPSQAKFIWGAQANIWTEYMAGERKVEYMLFPRLAALSEVLWSPKGKKDFPGFMQRLAAQEKRYEWWKVAFSRATF